MTCHLIFPACGCTPVEDLSSGSTPLVQDALDDLADDETMAERMQRLAEVLELLRKTKRRRGMLRLANFVKQAFAAKYPDTELEWGPHIEALCNHVQWQLEDRGRALVAREFVMRAQNILVNSCPRSLKTFIFTVATLWCWLHWPTTRIKYLSGNPRVALESGRMVHELVMSDWFVKTYQPNWTIRKDQSAPSDMANTLGGTRTADGLLASVVGTSCGWLIVDDAHDVHDSEAKIAATCEKYDMSVHNRIDDPRTGIRTCVMHRIRVTDLSSRLLATRTWLHIRIPMHYRVSTSCHCGTCASKNVFGWQDWRTKEGDVVHPRFTPAFIAEERERLSLHHDAFEALMEQEPRDMTKCMVPPTSWGFFRLSDFSVGDHPRPPACRQAMSPDQAPDPTLIVSRADLDEILITIDCANKSTAKGSRWAMLVVARSRQRRFVLEDGTLRGDLNLDVMPVLRRMIVQWRPRRVLIEDKAAGPSMLSTLHMEIAEGKIKDEHGQAVICTLEEIGADGGGGDKEARMSAVLLPIQSRLVYLLEGASWVVPFVSELGMFPRPPNDRGDALSQFLERVKGSGGSLLDLDPRKMERALTFSARPDHSL